MHSVISDLFWNTQENLIIPFFARIFNNFPCYIMCAGLFSFAIIVVEICLVFLWLLQIYPEFHVDMFGDISEDNDNLVNFPIQTSI